MSIKEQLDQLTTYVGQTETDLENIKNKLTEKKIEVPEGTKLSEIPPLIDSVKGGSELKINITADDYEGKTFTATHEDQETKATGIVSEKQTTILVPKGGTYTVTNDEDEQSQEATLVDSVDLNFIKFKATIKVTLDEDLIGSTVTCVLDDKSLEQEAESTEVTFSISKKGNWKVGIKGNSFITKNVNVQEAQEYTTTLTIATGVPVIDVTIDEILLGNTVTLTKDAEPIERKAETTSMKFILTELGNYTVALKEHTNIKAEVNVSEAKTYTAKLTVESGVPTITVRGKTEDDGKTVKVTKGETVLQENLKDGQAFFILPETGEWTVACAELEFQKVVNVAEAKPYSVSLSSSVFGVKITESESDPTNRVTYTDDAVDMAPVKITLEDGSVNYGTWKDTWIFEKIYPAMVKTDGSIAYKLDPEDQSQKAEGGASEVNSFDFDGNAMVVVEKFYTKFSMDGEDECIQVSDDKGEGFEAIGFIREDGSEADYICMPMFMGSFDSSNKLRSLSGQDIKYNTSFTDFRTAAQKNGSNYDIEVYAMNQILSALYLVLFKTCDWRNTLGEGRTYDNATNKKTGVLVNKGSIAFDPTTKATKFLWMEDFVSWPRSGTAIYRWEAGILCQNRKNYVRMKPPYSGTDVSTYEEVTDHVYKNGYISKMKADNKYGRVSVETSGTETTYETCYWNDSSNTSGNVYVSRRGYYFSVAGRALSSDASGTNASFGAALSLVPPA